MKNLLFLNTAVMTLAACLFSASAAAQPYSRINFSPLALVDPVLPCIQAGADHRFSERWGLLSELGIKYRRAIFEEYPDSAGRNWSGWRIRTEVRYYLKPENSGWKKTRKRDRFTYIAAQVFFLSDRHQNILSYYYRKDSLLPRNDVFHVKRKAWGLNLVLGKETDWESRFGLDYFFGAGIRFRSMRTNDQEVDLNLDQTISPIHPNVPHMLARTAARGGFSVTGNFLIGLRLFCRLGKL